MTILVPPQSPTSVDWCFRVNNAFAMASAGLSASGMSSAALVPDSRHVIRSVKFVNANVRVVSVLVDNLKVDVSANRGASLMAVAFFEAVDAAVGRDHLFKKSVILLKVCARPGRWVCGVCVRVRVPLLTHRLCRPIDSVAPQAWCHNESGTHCQGISIVDSSKGTMCTYAMEVLMVGVFNAYGSVIRHPLDAFTLFMYMFAEFPWDLYVWLVCNRNGLQCSRHLLPTTAQVHHHRSRPCAFIHWPTGLRVERKPAALFLG